MTKQESQSRRSSESDRTSERLPAAVYYVESDEDDSVLVGIDVRISGDWISWFDTVKERLMRGRVLENGPDRFSFKRTEGDSDQTYSFVPMTLDVYQSLVKDKLADGRDFDDPQSMVDAFLSTRTDSW